METVEGVEEEEGADLGVEVGGLTAPAVEGMGGGEEVGGGGAAGEGVEGLVADLGILGSDEVDEGVVHAIRRGGRVRAGRGVRGGG